MNILGPLKEIGIGMACSSCLNIQCVGQPYHRLRASRRCRSMYCHQHSALHTALVCSEKLNLLRSTYTDGAAARMGTFSSAAKLMACEQHRLGCPKSPKSPTIPSGASKLMGLARTSILTAFAAILGVTASTRADTLDTASPSSLLSTDGVIGIAFTVAVLALGALTLGVCASYGKHTAPVNVQQILHMSDVQ